MAQSLVWRHLSSDDWDKLSAAKFDPALVRSTCVDAPRGDSALHESQHSILGDLAYYTLQFASKRGYSAEKASALFGIVMTTHEEAIERNLLMDESFSHFKSLLLRHCVQRPPFSVQVFSFQDVHDITNYMTETYYRHYRLYQYSFTRRTVKDVTTKVIEVDEPKSDGHWPALNTALFEEQYFAQLEEAKKKAEEEAAAAAEAEAEAAEAETAAGGDKAKDEAAIADGDDAGEDGEVAAVVEEEESDDEVVFSEADKAALAALPSGKVQNAVTELLQQQLKAVKQDMRASLKAREGVVQDKLVAIQEAQEATQKGKGGKKK